jgi:hypothetical protein
MDLGASRHVTSCKSSLDSIDHVTRHETKIQIVDGENHSIKGKDSIKLTTNEGTINLTDILYVLSLQQNLTSVGALIDIRNILLFYNTTIWILNNLRDRKVIAIGHRNKSNGLYKMGKGVLNANTVTSLFIIELWHKKYGHLHFRALSLYKQT